MLLPSINRPLSVLPLFLLFCPIPQSLCPCSMDFLFMESDSDWLLLTHCWAEKRNHHLSPDFYWNFLPLQVWYHCYYCFPGYPFCRSGQENWWTESFTGRSGKISPHPEKVWSAHLCALLISSCSAEIIWIITLNLQDQNGMVVKRKGANI